MTPSPSHQLLKDNDNPFSFVSIVVCVRDGADRFNRFKAITIQQNDISRTAYLIFFNQSYQTKSGKH